MCRLCVLLALLGAGAGHATTYRVQFDGGVNAPSDGGTPFRGLGYALTQVQSGDTVVLADGLHDALSFTCDGGVPADITVRAEHERQARAYFLTLRSCRGWTVEGLRIGGAAALNPRLRVIDGDGVTVRRGLFDGPFEGVSDPLFAAALEMQGRRLVAEENEVLKWRRGGIRVDGDELEVRRNYLRTEVGELNSAAIEGHCTGCVFENNVSEGGDLGIHVTQPAVAVVLAGNLARGQRTAYEINYIPIGSPPSTSTLVDNVAIEQTERALQLEGGTCVAVASTVEASRGTLLLSFSRNMSSVTLRDTDFHGGEVVGRGLNRTTVTDSYWSSDAGDIAPLPDFPDAGIARANVERFGCWAYPPTYWPWRITDGGAVGADTRWRSLGGTRTAEPLWSLDGGAFPCGAAVRNVNDIAGASCGDVHLRFGVNRPQCPIDAPAPPPQFASVPSTEATCGETWEYRPLLVSTIPVQLSVTSDAGFTVADGVVTWRAPMSGSGSAVLDAVSTAGRVSQHIEVRVNCAPQPGCSAGGGALLPAALALWWRRRVRSRRSAAAGSSA